jgi:hypothetical protein
MTKKQIQAIQERIGTKPDGFWGPKSIAACQAHLRGLMPKPNPWPAQSQSALQAFYGSPGDESRLVTLPVKDYGLRFDGKPVSTLRCHAKVAASLARILANLSVTHPQVLREYAGVYVNRTMRGGSLPSLHARGAAIDLMPATNGNRTAWPVASTMPIEVNETFAEEGWLSAGAFWGRDGMHFEATR